MRGWLFGIGFLAMGCSDATIKTFNAEPTASINSHVDRDEIGEEAVTALFGKVADSNHSTDTLLATWYVDGEIVCDAATPEPEGATACEAVLPTGLIRVLLEVSDPNGASGNDAVRITVIPSTPPEVSILDPYVDGPYRTDEPIRFRGRILDAEDGFDRLSAWWNSSEDGDLELGTTLSADGIVDDYASLSPGIHVITLGAEDSSGKQTEVEVIIDVGGANTAPTIISVEITPDTDVSTSTALTCAATYEDADGETLTIDYGWTNAAGDALGTGSALGLEPLVVAPGDVITCTASVTDGDGESASGTDSVTVINTAPNLTSVEITPDTDVTIYTALSCNAVAEDDDGTVPTITYAWDIDSTPVGTGDALDLATTAGTRGDTVTCTATATDGTDETTGTDSVVIENTAPEIDSVVLTPDEVYTNDTITATVTTSDAEGDAVSVNIDWYVEEALVASGSGTTLSGVSYFDKHDEVYVVATPDDGTETGDSMTSATITVLNTPPTAPEVSIDRSTGIGWDLLASGYDHNCAIEPSGSITCWGGDTYGQVSETPTDSGYTTVSSGYYHNCARTSAGEIECWGHDVYGQVSDAPTGTGFVTVGAGSSFNCAIAAAGHLDCWGHNNNGQVSDAPTSTPFTAVGSGGGWHMCAIDSSDTLHCWGRDDTGQVSDKPSGSFAAVSDGGIFSCALDTSGIPHCWGSNEYGQTSGAPTGAGYEDICAGWQFGCALAADGAIECWGRDHYGQISDAVTGTYAGVTCGEMHACAIDADGNIECWGNDEFGQVIDIPELEGASVDLVCSIDTPSTDDDGDSITYTFDWDVDGTAFTDTETTTETGDTVPADALGDDETWTCEVTPNDGDDDGEAGSASWLIEGPVDDDGDGYTDDEDCDDTDPSIHPTAGDSYGDGVDGDCDGLDCEAAWYRGTYFVACYDPRTWDSAQTTCHGAGYDGLVTLTSEAENTFVAELLPVSGSSEAYLYWIGFTDQDAEGSWTWSSGLPVSYTNWNSGEPSDGGSSSEDCGHMYPSWFSVFGRWNDHPCSHGQSYVCELRGDGCWDTRFGDSSYTFCDGPKTRVDAEADCLDRDMDLVKIESGEENDFIWEESVTMGGWGHPGPWIGLQDEDLDGTFAWNDETSITYEDWCPSHPIAPGSRAYVHMEIAASDYPCWAANGSSSTAELQYVCEYAHLDEDGDGYTTLDDCDDDDATIHPMAGDVYEDGVDSDCDGIDCEAAWHGTTYFALCEMSEWEDGGDLCDAGGYDFGSVRSDDENLFITELMRESVLFFYPGALVGEALWLGYSDRAEEGLWVWEDGYTGAYTNWAPGEPNDSGGQDCAYLDTNPATRDGEWDDANCDIGGDRVILCNAR